MCRATSRRDIRPQTQLSDHYNGRFLKRQTDKCANCVRYTQFARVVNLRLLIAKEDQIVSCSASQHSQPSKKTTGNLSVLLAASQTWPYPQQLWVF